ncbi:MAG: tetratricopeptide repeat protein [Pseudomonadota bacterium]
MKNRKLPTLVVAVVAAAAALKTPAFANDGSLAVCADLGASAGDVALHCRRAIASGGLSDGQAFGANVNLGEALISLGQPSLAVDAFNAALALRPNRIEPVIGRADALEEMGRMDDAARDWFAAVRIDPGSMDARMGKGAFHLRAGAPAAALVEFDNAVRIDREDPDAYFNRGLAHLALGRQSEAERDFTEVLREYPTDAGAFFQRARARSGANDQGALADYARAAELAPEWSDPWYLAGRILDGQGRTNEANQRFRRAFELGHKDPWLLNRITALGG